MKAFTTTAVVLALCVIAGVIFLLRAEPAVTRPQHAYESATATPAPQDSVISPTPAATIQPPEASESADLTLRPKLKIRQGNPPAEARLEAIVENSNLTDEAKARHLLASLGSVPEEFLITTTEAALQRLPDKAYNTALPHLLNPQTHGQVLSVLFSDLLERPDAVTLPALADVAATSGHPFAESARDNLRLLLGAEPSSDRATIQAQVRQALLVGPPLEP